VLRRFTEAPALRPAREWSRGVANRIRYGREAPRPNERLWVDPSSVVNALDGLPVRSGAVISQWPPAELIPFDEHVHVRFALAHWRDGVPWEETGAYDYMLERIRVRGQQDGCRDLADVRRRYVRLDELFETAQRERRLRTRTELDETAREEDGGILMHIGPHGTPAIGDGGKHRLTIAKLLELPVVPVRVGYVHRDAVPLLRELRRSP